MSEPNRKRARDDSVSQDREDPVAGGATLQTSSAQQDSQFWFEDGNIILVSRNVSFKVYRGLLAEHSSVFRSMFDIAQGAQSAAEQMDGCPVVLLDDSPDDLRELFRLTLPLNSSTKLTRDEVDIDTLTTLIRLDHKYELTALCEEAIRYLKAYYTTDFDTWIDQRSTSRWQPQPVHAIGAIALADLTDTKSILPTAFYVCCTLSPEELVRGYTTKHGVQCRLPDAALERCLRMRDALTQLNMVLGMKLFKNSSPQCSNVHQTPQRLGCTRVLAALMEKSAIYGELPHALADPRVLESWHGNIKKFQSQTGVPRAQLASRVLCDACKVFIEEKDLELRRDAWGLLPVALDIPVEGWSAKPNSAAQ